MERLEKDTYPRDFKLPRKVEEGSLVSRDKESYDLRQMSSLSHDPLTCLNAPVLEALNKEDLESKTMDIVMCSSRTNRINNVDFDPEDLIDPGIWPIDLEIDWIPPICLRLKGQFWSLPK